MQSTGEATRRITQMRGGAVLIVALTTGLPLPQCPSLAGLSRLSWPRCLPPNLPGGQNWRTGPTQLLRRQP